MDENPGKELNKTKNNETTIVIIFQYKNNLRLMSPEFHVKINVFNKKENSRIVSAAIAKHPVRIPHISQPPHPWRNVYGRE